MPIFKINHITKYSYDREVKESVNEIKIYPYKCREQEVLHDELNITGDPAVEIYTDYWGNKTGVFNLLPLHKELIISSQLLIRTTSPSEISVPFDTSFEELKEEVDGHLQMIELAYIDSINSQADIEQIANNVYKDGKSVAATVGDCCT